MNAAPSNPYSPAERAGPLGVLGRLAVFSMGFALALALYHSWAVPGGGGLVGAKQEHFARARGRYDTVVLGTSHFYRSFVPEEFDRAAAEGGLSSSSFNFGIQLPNLIELDYLFHRVLEQGGEGLQRVFVQYYELTPQIDPNQAFIERNVYWHDWARTRLAAGFALAADRSPGGLRYLEPSRGKYSALGVLQRWAPAGWRVAIEHYQHFLTRALLIGRGRAVARGLLGRESGLTAGVAQGRGYLSLEEENQRLLARGLDENSYQRRRQHFLENRDAYQRSLEALRTEEVHFGDEEWMLADLQRFAGLEVYQGMARAARERGVELIVVVMPANSCSRVLEARLAVELGVPVLRFNDPDRYPDLYDPDLRFDSGHLSDEGARLFSRLLAQRYLETREGSQ